MTSRSVGRSHGIDGDYLGQVYKDHLSDFEHWDQKAHAKEWILIAKNMGKHLSIDECMYCGRLYTFVSNKDAHGGRGYLSVYAVMRVCVGCHGKIRVRHYRTTRIKSGRSVLCPIIFYPSIGISVLMLHIIIYYLLFFPKRSE